MGFLWRAAKRARAQKRRSDYRRYLASPQWQAKRRQYRSSGRPQACVACGTPWQAGHHLHHLTYRRVGRERLTDLVLVCDRCHTEIHQLNRSRRDLRSSTATVIRRHARERARRKRITTPR